MNIILLAATMLCLFLAGSFVLVFRKLAADGSSLPAEDDWFDAASPERYRPMERLLNESEYQTLQAHPAFDSKMLRQFRMQRVRAYRGYLRSLSFDYGRVCNAIKSLIVESSQDRPDLAALLMRQRMTFTLRFMLAQGRLTLHAWGVGTVDVGKLVAALESMRLELNTLVEAVQPAAA